MDIFFNTQKTTSLNPVKTFLLALFLILTSANAWGIALVSSPGPDRSGAELLDGTQVWGEIYVFLDTDSGIQSVDFYLNGSHYIRENFAPWDFAGTSSNGDSLPFDSTVLSAGTHTITAEINRTDGSIEYASASVTIEDIGFHFTPPTLSFTVTEPETVAQATINVSDATDSEEIYTVISNAPWLSVTPEMAITPSSHTISVSVEELDYGVYQSELIFEGPTTARVPVSLVYESLESSSFYLMVSDDSSRAQSVALDGEELIGNAYIHLQPEQGVRRVDFFINSSASGSPYKVESLSPFDLAGTNSDGSALAFDSTALTDGSNFVTAVVYGQSGSQEVVTANFTVSNNSEAAFTLSPSGVVANANLGDSPVEETILLGLNAIGDGLSPSYSVSENVPWLNISPASGNAPEALTVTMDPTGLAGGTYVASITITSETLPTTQLPVSFTVLDGLPSLIANPRLVNLTASPDSGIQTTSFDISTSDGASTSYSDTSNQPWLTIEGSSGATPETVTLKVDTSGLALGVYEAQLELMANGYAPTTVALILEVADENDCGPVPCEGIRVELPYLLDFASDNGGVADNFGVGTGFTYVLPSSKINSYLPENLEVDLSSGVLNILSTNGILFSSENNQANPVGAGFAGPNQITRISTRLNNPHPGTGRHEQAGLWFGYNEDSYVKFVYGSFPIGGVLEFAYEEGGSTIDRALENVGNISNAHLDLELVADPTTRTVTAYYSISNGFTVELATFDIEPEFFSFDAAGLDPVIGTRSFAGIMATHRNGASPITYEFERFGIEADDQTAPEASFNFSRTSHSIDFPTSMVWAPDGKLYVTEMFGDIHALTFNENLELVSDEVITSLVDTLGQRLTLGITLFDDDPSDPDHYSLWVASSSPSVNNGTANSSNVTRLSGPNFETVDQVITGLPRAIANHAINNLHFGPDDRLYIAMGGNTGAGAVVTVPTEFGDRAEQPLSAAILVADVLSSGFNGDCANNVDIYGPVNCDVAPYATGLRNSYDFVFHTNNEMYASDNGLGVAGAFPPSPVPDCSGTSNTAPVAQGGNNPGAQPDLLLRIQEGGYYGHPNPSRGECVFKDGSLQGVPPLPNFEPPIGNLGMNASANGIIEFRSPKACGKLQTDLLVVRYSLGDDIVRVKLSEDGLSVAAQEVLVSGFNDPLALSEREGNLFVAEFGSDQITVLQLEPIACWSNGEPLPRVILDAGGASLGNYLYSIGGKTSSGPNRDVYRYDVEFDSWTQLASKPGSAVENAAVAAESQYIYVMGGSTGPFSGAVDEVWRYDTVTDVWDALAPMPQAVGGVTAQIIDDKIYVAGGMDGQGASVTSLQIYDIASNSWVLGPSLNQPRDNAGTAVVNGELYVLSGRHRLADGTTFNAGVQSMEIFDPQAAAWREGPTMPRGRRAFSVGTINGQLQLVGGETNPDAPGNLFHAIDVFDPQTDTWSALDNAPSPRHGAASATINNQLIIVGGGDSAGSSYTDTTQIMRLD